MRRIADEATAKRPETACARGRTYILALQWGESGWYYELPDLTAATNIIPMIRGKEGLELFAQRIEAPVSRSASRRASGAGQVRVKREDTGIRAVEALRKYFRSETAHRGARGHSVSTI